MTYNLSMFNSTSGQNVTPITFIQFLDSSTGNIFGLISPLIIFGIIFITLKGYGTRAASTAASMAALMWVFYGSFLGIVPTISFLATVVLTAGVFIFLRKSG